MKPNIYLVFLFFVAVAFFMACGSPEHPNRMISPGTSTTAIIENKNYVVVNAEKKETATKAQMKVTAYLKQDLQDKAELNNMLKTIYEQYRHESGYSNFDEPTVVAVYLFETEKMLKSDPSSWIGMLIKGPNDNSPHLSLNDFKVVAALGLKDTVLSKDEIELGKMNKLLQSRNIDMCDLNRIVNAIELNSIRTADKRYPNYGNDHDEYADQLIAIGLKKLKKKYRLTEDDIDMVSALALVYCK